MGSIARTLKRKWGRFSSLCALENVILTTICGASNENFVKMMTFPLECILLCIRDNGLQYCWLDYCKQNVFHIACLLLSYLKICMAYMSSIFYEICTWFWRAVCCCDYVVWSQCIHVVYWCDLAISLSLESDRKIYPINGLVQDCIISSVLAMEIPQSYNKPLICHIMQIFLLRFDLLLKCNQFLWIYAVY